MRLADAESLWPSGEARFVAHDPRADRDRLRELAAIGQQYSPTVALDPAESPECLFLDATGCGYAYGGEAGFAGAVVAAVRDRGYWGVAAVADTVGAAWAVARHGSGKRALAREARARVIVVPPGEQAAALGPLPVEALRLADRVVEVLAELNVDRIDQLLALPRNQLPARFGADVLAQIDRALGARPEGLIAERVVEPLEARWDFELPVEDSRVLVAVVDQLLEKVLKPIRNEAVGVKRLLWWLKAQGHGQLCFPVELLRPTALQKTLVELIRLQLERAKLSGEVTQVALRATVAPLVFRQDDLFGGAVGPNRREDVSDLIERLASRLGSAAVLRPQLRADAQPELAFEYGPWLVVVPARPGVGRSPKRERGSSDTARPGPAGPPPSLTLRAPAGLLTRPPRLEPEPVPIEVQSAYPGGPPRRVEWEDRSYTIARTWGPERIETGWWRGADIRRDYYVAQAAGGERFWLFRDLAAGGWFLHGGFE
jgi:protein ImuB